MGCVGWVSCKPLCLEKGKSRMHFNNEFEIFVQIENKIEPF